MQALHAAELFRNVSSLWNKVPEKEFELNRFHQAARNLSEEGQRNIRILRNWAKSKGWVKAPNPHGGPEEWGVLQKNGEIDWRLKIKPEPSTRDVESNFARFDARIFVTKKPIGYVNPFTGARGGRSVGTHISLEDPYKVKNELNEIISPKPNM